MTIRVLLALALLSLSGCTTHHYALRACSDHCNIDGDCVFLMGKDGEIGSATLEESTFVLCCGPHLAGIQSSPPTPAEWPIKCAR